MIDKDRLFEIDNGIALPHLQAGLVQFGKSAAWFSNVVSQKVTYSGDNISSIEFYVTAAQLLTDRVVKVEISYTSGNPTSEVWSLYDSDGTTILETRTVTYTYTGDNITSASEVIA